MKCPRGPLLFVGDSLAVGLSPRFQQMADECFIANKESVSYRGSATGGTGAAYWTRKLEALLVDHKPAFVLFSLGGNDYRSPGAPAAIKKLVAMARARGAQPLWLRWNVEDATYNGKPLTDDVGVEEAWLAESIPWFDGGALSIEKGADKIHPTPAGYDKLATLTWRWLAKVTAPGGGGRGRLVCALLATGLLGAALALGRVVRSGS